MAVESPQCVEAASEGRASQPVTGRIVSWADRHRVWLFVGVVLIYLLGFNGQWRATPDTGLHLSIARNIVEGNGFTHPLGDHVRANPGLSYLLSTAMHVAGPEQLWLPNLIMFGLGLATLGVAYRWFMLIVGRPGAVALTVMLGLSLTFYQHAFYLLTEMPFMFGVMLFLLGWEQVMRRGRLRVADVLLLAAGAGVMVAFRTVAITFLGAVVLAVVWHVVRSGDRRLWIGGGVLAAVCAVGLLAAVMTSHGLAGGNDNPKIRADTELIVRRLSNIGDVLVERTPWNALDIVQSEAPRAMMGLTLGPIANVPVGLLVLGLGIGLMRRHVLGGLLVVAFVTQMLLFVATSRYFMPVLPVLLLGWWYGAQWVERRWGPWGGRLCMAMLVVWFVPNVIRTGDFIISQRLVPFMEHHSHGRYAAAYELRDALREAMPAQLPAGSLILTDHRDLHVLIYLTMSLDVDVVSRRYLAVQDDVDDPLYVLEPRGRRVNRLIRREGWKLGQPVIEVGARPEVEPFRVRPVLRRDEREATLPASASSP